MDQIHLLMVGEVSPEISDWLAVEDCDITYTEVPFVQREQLIPYYLSCDCVAIPSFYDGTPNVLLEAGALGVPVLRDSLYSLRLTAA